MKALPCGSVVEELVKFFGKEKAKELIKKGEKQFKESQKLYAAHVRA